MRFSREEYRLTLRFLKIMAKTSYIGLNTARRTTIKKEIDYRSSGIVHALVAYSSAICYRGRFFNEKGSSCLKLVSCPVCISECESRGLNVET